MTVRSWLNERVDIITEPIQMLGDKLDTFLNTQLETVLHRFGLGFIDTLESEAIEYYKPLLDNALLNPAIPDNIKRLIRGLTRHTHPIQFVALLPVIAILAIPLIMAAFGGQIMQVTQAGMKWSRPTVLSPGEAITALWRSEINAEEFNDNMAQLGYSDSIQETLKNISRYIPQINDLIRFTVRDVFNPEVVQKFNYDADFDKIADNLKPHLDKIGVDIETVRLYWRAHWELPSISLAYEMLHRDIINEEDIKELLRINDVAPAWIDPIVSASYNNYTRVDVRRMYEAGTLDRPAMKRAYLDLGYNEEKAENMTAWSVAYATTAERDVTKSEIISAYSGSVITITEAESMLEDLGYSLEEVELIISLADYKIEKSISTREKRVLSTQYVNGRITAVKFKASVQALGVSEREMTLIKDEADARIKEKHKSPTKADLDKWLKAEIITVSDYRGEMQYLGYSEYHTDKYLEVM